MTEITDAGAVRREDRMADRVPARAAERTGKLDRLRETFQRRRAELLGNRDLTAEARTRQLRELERGYEEAFEEETRLVMEELDKEIEAAYKKAYGPPAKPSRYPAPDTEEEILKELRLQRIRAEVVDEFVAGADPVYAYEHAIRVGDRERRDVIEKTAPVFLDDPDRKRRLRELAEEQLPEARRKARKELELLEGERRHLELGFALGRPRRTA